MVFFDLKKIALGWKSRAARPTSFSPPPDPPPDPALALPMLPCFGPSGTGYEAGVRTVVFFAGHQPLSPVDDIILAHAVHELAQLGPPHGPARLWLLLHMNQIGPDEFHAAEVLSVRIRAGVCLWSEALIWKALPGVQQFLNTSLGFARETTPYLKMYYYMHTPLYLWLKTYGAAHGSVRHYWRFEFDALWAGSWSSLFEISARTDADLLLPWYIQGTPSYYHYANNPAVVSLVPEPMWALVSMGRYSPRFFDIIAARFWHRGVTGYEEILLPMACYLENTATPGTCRMWAFHRGRGPLQGIGNLGVAKHFRFTPSFSCEVFLSALQRSEEQLWHPVKGRGCIARHLLNQSAVGGARPAWDPDGALAIAVGSVPTRHAALPLGEPDDWLEIPAGPQAHREPRGRPPFHRSSGCPCLPWHTELLSEADCSILCRQAKGRTRRYLNG